MSDQQIAVADRHRIIGQVRDVIMARQQVVPNRQDEGIVDQMVGSIVPLFTSFSMSELIQFVIITFHFLTDSIDKINQATASFRTELQPLENDIETKYDAVSDVYARIVAFSEKMSLMTKEELMGERLMRLNQFEDFYLKACSVFNAIGRYERRLKSKVEETQKVLNGQKWSEGAIVALQIGGNAIALIIGAVIAQYVPGGFSSIVGTIETIGARLIGGAVAVGGSLGSYTVGKSMEFINDNIEMCLGNLADETETMKNAITEIKRIIQAMINSNRSIQTDFGKKLQ